MSAGEWVGGSTLFTDRHLTEIAAIVPGRGGEGGGSPVHPPPTAAASTTVLLQLNRFHLDSWIGSLAGGAELLKAWREADKAAHAPKTGKPSKAKPVVPKVVFKEEV